MRTCSWACSRRWLGVFVVVRGAGCGVTGQEGRPSRSLTLGQAGSLLAVAETSPLGAYVVLCLLTGVRTEEARALTWDHVDVDGNAAIDPQIPPYVAVWGPCVPTGTRRRSGPDGRCNSQSARSRRCGSIGSSRPGSGCWRVTCGRTAVSCSVHRSDRRSTRRTCAGSSGRNPSVSGYPRPMLRLVPEEPEQVLRLALYRDQHPGVLIREGTGYWQAQIPEAVGETVITRYRLCELLDKLDEQTGSVAELGPPRSGTCVIP
jgi:hypothetical protein